MTDGTHDVQGADDSRGAEGEQGEHGLGAGKASSSGGHDEDLIAELDAYGERRRAELWALPLADRKALAANWSDALDPITLPPVQAEAAPPGLAAELEVAMRTPIPTAAAALVEAMGGPVQFPADIDRLDALVRGATAEAAAVGLALMLCRRCDQWAYRDMTTGAVLGHLAPADDVRCHPPEVEADHMAKLLAMMGDPPAVVVGAGTPEDPYRELTTPLIASHCLGPEPWWARHERPLRAALWGVVALVGACTVVSVFTAEPGVWLRGLLGTTAGAFALLVTRRGRRGWGPR